MTTRKPKKTKTSTSAPLPSTQEQDKADTSKRFADLLTRSVLAVDAAHSHSRMGSVLEFTDLVDAMRQAGDEVVAGDFGRVERMLTSQLITLDVLFSNLATRSSRQESFTGIEKLMRLALKAQSQARATAETLAVIKNPMPYIRQANIAHGNQQVNNGVQPAPSRAEKIENAPSKLLENQNDQWLDAGAPAATGTTDTALETVGAKYRAKDR